MSGPVPGATPGTPAAPTAADPPFTPTPAAAFATSAVPSSPDLRLAGAPISWGVCEVPGWGPMLPTDTVLGEMAELGLTATESGPPGYLPDDPTVLKGVLAGHGLTLVGSFAALVLHERDRVAQSAAAAERTAALIAAAGGEVLVLAAATGLDGYDARPELSGAQWRCLIEAAEEVARIAGGYGLRTTLHPHVGTHVETSTEVERFLDDSTLPLCLDTGHLLIGGTDPLDLVRRHPDRIGHVHLKDVHADTAALVRSGALTYADAVGRGIYRPLGEGDVPVAEIVATLRAAGYRDWYVLEQDTRLTDDPDDANLPRHDTARSLAHLRGI
ncbi:TIM barrel protein [Embleya scabrispora]|uniref:TIM barrel protein n=1 Tax=Embleya scabrispora TaxID=159449 RepID=UPI000380590C|nr:TIM barrel protein [Embleya scabrispora]MYS87919.1 TIM barrel protein [Streptomyces sp. SID5474]